MKRLLIIFIAVLFSSVFPQTMEAQENQKGVPFNGIITDVTNNPIKGAKIYVVNDKFFARSDKNGKFGLTNVLPTDTLHIRYKKIQYDIPVDGKKSIRIHLGDQFEANEDEQLVSFGYGFVKRRESILPSNGISGDILVRTGKNNIIEALDGLVPGMSVSGGKVIIRGLSTINSGTDPLYIVDGMEVSSLDMINIYDVDHIEVMKDASIYGVRGANGAILVFTKRGK